MKNLLVFFVFSSLIFGFKLTNAQVLDSSPRDGVFDKIHTESREPIPYTPVREADVVWSKRIWRIIDFRQKINQPFYYPETPKKGWRNFMTIVLDALKEGTITAYDPVQDDQFTVPMVYQEMINKYSGRDSTAKRDPENPERIIGWEYFTEELNTSDIHKIEIKEDWFFDKQRSVMDVRIIGICPIIEIYENGEHMGAERMFWIYFPEARKVFAKSEVFNRQNGAERRTYDDIFWKRIFGSYIVKEENVYDRTIRDYASGMDALLESERIKNDLFEFEHDLWEF